MTSVQFDRVSKWYPMYSSLRGLKASLAHLPALLRSLKSEKFAALQDVSFTVRQGETVGLIGSNGSGKSTTLGLIAGVLVPQQGCVEVQGRVCPLLELGAGFHPELTGRDNLMLNGVLLGLTRREIRQRMDAIIAFSELEAFLDQPLRTYSTGMLARLGFSVAAHLDPDIFLIDEILAVGDLHFQSKCRRKMEEFKARGVTIILVTHSVAEVAQLCDRAIWLDQGRVIEDGDAQKVLGQYQRFQLSRDAMGVAAEQAELISAQSVHARHPAGPHP